MREETETIYILFFVNGMGAWTHCRQNDNTHFHRVDAFSSELRDADVIYGFNEFVIGIECRQLNCLC